MNFSFLFCESLHQSIKITWCQHHLLNKQPITQSNILVQRTLYYRKSTLEVTLVGTNSDFNRGKFASNFSCSLYIPFFEELHVFFVQKPTSTHMEVHQMKASLFRKTLICQIPGYNIDDIIDDIIQYF